MKDKTKTTSEILNEVLDVPSSMAVWLENDLQIILQKFSQRKMTPLDFEELRNDLKGLGLERLLPNAMTNILSARE